MSFLIKYVDYNEQKHMLVVTAHRLEKKEEQITFSSCSEQAQPSWLTDKEYAACRYLYQCIHSIQNGNYRLHFGEYFKRNDLKLVGFTMESPLITLPDVPLEYLFVGNRFGAVRFKDVPSLMVNVPHFQVLEKAFLTTSPHRLRLLV